MLCRQQQGGLVPPPDRVSSAAKQPLLLVPARQPSARHRLSSAASRASPINASAVSYTLQDIRYARDILRQLTASGRYTRARRRLPEAWLDIAGPFIRTLDDLRAIAGRVLPPAAAAARANGSRGSRRALDQCPLQPLDPRDPEAALVGLIEGLHAAMANGAGCDWIEYARVVLFTLHDMVTASAPAPAISCRSWAALLDELVGVLLALYERYRNALTPYDRAAMEDVQALVLQLVAVAGCGEDAGAGAVAMAQKLQPAHGSTLAQWIQAIRDPAYRTDERFIAADMLTSPAAYVSLVSALYAAVDAITDMAAMMEEPPAAAVAAGKTDAEIFTNIAKTQFEVIGPSIAQLDLTSIGLGLPSAVMNSVRYRIFEPIIHHYISTMRRLYSDAGVRSAMADAVFAALDKHAYNNPVQLLPVYLDRARGALGALHTVFLKGRCAAAVAAPGQ